MKNTLIFLGLGLSILFALGCTHEETPDLDPDPEPPPTEFVPIYNPCDTTTGAAVGNKLNTPWKASVFCNKQSINGVLHYTLRFETCTVYGGFQRESLSIGPFLNKDAKGGHPLQSADEPVEPGHFMAGYSTLIDDGNLVEDIYVLDTTSRKNYLKIEKWDIIHNRAEGILSIALDIKEPRINAKNPKHVAFSAVRFWCKIFN